MSNRFKDYDDAKAYAIEQVKLLGIAHGIEKMEDPFAPRKGKKITAIVYVVHMLPLPQNRQGFELRCEAVEPGGW